jgi:hypothetical protein
MRSLAIAVALLATATTAHASDWPGTWAVDGGGERTLVEQGHLLCLDASLPAAGGQVSFHFVGAPDGHRLHLEGHAAASVGFVGALDGHKNDGKHHLAVVDADLDRGTIEARIRVDQESPTNETWRRGELEITELLSDGLPVAGAFDAKRSRSGLVVHYRTSGTTMKLALRVVVGEGHPYATFYADPRIHEADLGTVPPGEHEATWDGRDDTSARRIALGGAYNIIITSGAVHAERALSVTPPRFEAIGSSWPATTVSIDARGIPHSSSAWDPSAHIRDLASLVVTSLGEPGKPGFDFEGPRIVTSVDDVARYAEDAGALLLTTHGAPGSLSVHDGTGRISYDPKDTFGRSLVDVHFALVSACSSGAGEPSVAEKLVAAGCDVVLGFAKPVGIAESEDFEKLSLVLLSLGAPIEKASRDAARLVHPFHLELPERGDHVESCLVVKRAAGIPEDETLWPPRYGCSTN